MKRSFIVLGLLGVLLSCKDKKQEEKADEIITTGVPGTDTSFYHAVINIPNFSNSELQIAANEYSVLMTGYPSNKADTAKRKEFNTKVLGWSKKNGTVFLKAMKTPEDSVKLAKWLSSVLTQIKK